MAAYDSDAFQGKPTANRETFDQAGMTAAHKTLPFGTRVKVTNLTNDKSVVVTINDRMALLYLPLHIVWLEMLIHPTALLVFQGLASLDGLKPVDRRRVVRFFSRAEWLLIGMVGVLVTALVTAGYLRSFNTGNVDHGRSMALAVLTLSSATIAVVLSRLRTTASRAIVAGTIGLSVVLTQVQPLAPGLHLEPLHADDWAIAAFGSLLAGALPLLLEHARPARRDP